MDPKEFQKKEYWEERTRKGREAGNETDVIFEDPRFGVMTDRAIKALAMIRPEWTVLDVCCGYGRFSKYVDQNKYTGMHSCKQTN